ncbi:MAG TPA: hypothetical protein VM287_11205 [Egibacteraceae bacterium]|nr:hypothetical protein [Egibacteraceae bacterium]
MTTQTVSVADARSWAAWIRGVRADIAARMDEGHINPDLAAPEAVHTALLWLLAAIDDLPYDRETADLRLPDDVQLQGLLDHLARLQRWFDQLADWAMVSHRRSEPVIRFQRALAAFPTSR